MNNIEKLQTVLFEEFLPELEESLKEMASYVQSWKATQEDKEEFEDLKEMKGYFENILEDIKNKSLNNDDAKEILEALEEIRL
jgi:hypothetical protein